MKYRKKPVVIEAFQYDGDLKGTDGQYYVPNWAIKAYEDGTMYYGELDGQPGELFIKTLEGVHHASVGDYIIKGVNGELYPCKPDIFEKTYEVADYSSKIRIESDGHFAKVYLDGEKVRCTFLDFHGHVDNNVRLVDGDVVTGGICIKWDGTVQKLNENGQPYVDENGELATEKFHYDNREAVVE